MWYIGYMCEDDIIIYFPVDLNSTYEIVHFDTCLGKAYGAIYKYNKEVYDRLHVNVGIYEETIYYDPDDPFDIEYNVPAFKTKEEAEKYINKHLDGNYGIGIDQ